MKNSIHIINYVFACVLIVYFIFKNLPVDRHLPTRRRHRPVQLARSGGPTISKAAQRQKCGARFELCQRSGPQGQGEPSDQVGTGRVRALCPEENLFREFPGGRLSRRGIHAPGRCHLEVRGLRVDAGGAWRQATSWYVHPLRRPVDHGGCLQKITI